MTEKYFTSPNGKYELNLVYIDETICDGYVLDTIYTVVAYSDGDSVVIKDYSTKHMDAIKDFAETYGLEIA